MHSSFSNTDLTIDFYKYFIGVILPTIFSYYQRIVIIIIIISYFPIMRIDNILGLGYTYRGNAVLDIRHTITRTLVYTLL